MTRELPTRDLRQITILHKVVLCVDSLFSEEYSIGCDMITQNRETSIHILIYTFKKIFQTEHSNFRPSAAKATVLSTKPRRL